MQNDFRDIDFLAIECNADELKAYQQKIGKKVQQLRQKKGLSQLELSYLMGFKSTSLLAGAEAGYGSVKFSIEHLYKIAKILCVEIKEFFE